MMGTFMLCQPKLCEGKAKDGQLTFIDTAIYYPALGYEMTDLNGDVAFTKDSIFADPILVNIGGAVPTNTRNAQLP